MIIVKWNKKIIFLFYFINILAGPSEKYWEVIAERRRKALEDVLEQNRNLHSVIMALEEENLSCKKLLEETTDLVKTLKVKSIWFNIVHNFTKLYEQI